jgi:hypothetical protein
LAISSVQLFIQRCLLNLEARVSPFAINSKYWQWMKRYRVWEANRKIFLFPENWLEPEFRDDKTHIFQELESALLQGDVSNDLVEDAFFNYLKKLEELARLDMVTMYCEEKPDDPASNTLHVIGRTYSLPHKYFYRRYSHQMWTPWEPVTAEIEGDHVVAVIWQQRLHLFWVTFLEKPKQEDIAQSRTIQKLADPNTLLSTEVKKEVQIQLNWSEYYQGQWTTRESSGFENPIRTDIYNNTFDKNRVFIFASLKEDGSLLVNLGAPIYMAFRIVSKNDSPKPFTPIESPQTMPYSATEIKATKYAGSGELDLLLATEIKTEDDKTTISSQLTQRIIQGIIGGSGGGGGGGNDFSILPCIIPSTLIDKIQTQSKQLYVKLNELALGAPSLPNIKEKLSTFANSISLRLGNPSLGLLSTISNDWKAIYSGIIGLGIFNIFNAAGFRPGVGGSGVIGEDFGRLFPDAFLPEPKRTILYTLRDINRSMGELEQAVDAGRLTDMLEAERRRLDNPFFYQDELHSFFVEPTLTETTITEWQYWAIPYDLQRAVRVTPNDLENLYVEATIPVKSGAPPLPRPDPEARFKIKPIGDWVTHPSTVMVFDNRLIGQQGRIHVKAAPSDDITATAAATTATTTDTERASDAAGSVVASGGGSITTNTSGVTTPNVIKVKPHIISSPDAGDLNVIDSNTMNPAVVGRLRVGQRQGGRISE